MGKKLSLSLKDLIVFATAFLFNSAYATTYLAPQAGIANEGDDRVRPEIGLIAEVKSFYLHTIAYGRKYSLVTQQSLIISTGGKFELPTGPKSLNTYVGLSYLRDKTSLAATPTTSKETETLQNFGLTLGVGWKCYEGKNSFVGLNWESHVFPAGTAILFLSTGRIDSLFLSAGVKL